MAVRLQTLCWDAADPAALARFWARLLGWEAEGVLLRPDDDTGFAIRFEPTAAPKTRRNQMHLDLTSSSPQHQQETVAQALSLGGAHLDVGQLPEEGHVVLADPEGNELCVIEPGNRFLAECGFVGAVSSDGSREVGLFWSAALRWPLVWDQDEETAIRSPHGGPKITWGGPPLAHREGRNRLRFELPEQCQVEVGGQDDGPSEVLLLLPAQEAHRASERGHRDRDDVVQGRCAVVVQPVGGTHEDLAGQALDGRRDGLDGRRRHRAAGGCTRPDQHGTGPVEVRRPGRATRPRVAGSARRHRRSVGASPAPALMPPARPCCAPDRSSARSRKATIGSGSRTATSVVTSRRCGGGSRIGTAGAQVSSGFRNRGVLRFTVGRGRAPLVVPDDVQRGGGGWIQGSGRTAARGPVSAGC
jgi:hypothetical protein